MRLTVWCGAPLHSTVVCSLHFELPSVAITPRLQRRTYPLGADLAEHFNRRPDQLDLD